MWTPTSNFAMTSVHFTTRLITSGGIVLQRFDVLLQLHHTMTMLNYEPFLASHFRTMGLELTPAWRDGSPGLVDVAQ